MQLLKLFFNQEGRSLRVPQSGDTFNKSLHEPSVWFESLAVNQESKSISARSLVLAVLVIVGVVGFLTLPSGGFASTAPVQAQTATYTIVTSTGSFYGTPGRLQCSPTGCVYLPGPYQYRVNPQTPGYYNGVYYAYVNDVYYPPCQPDLTTHMVSCSGFVYEPQSGCTELVVVIANGYIPENYSYQYYTLHNLASNSTLDGQFVAVSGQLFQGPNNSSTGAACPGSYINVASVTQP